MERYDALSTACDAVILANGQFPRHRVPTRVLEEAKLLVCCDGALATLHRERPELEARLLSEGRLLATGDGDSLSPALRERYGAIFRQVYEQDDNDLTKATRLVLSLVKSAGRQPVVAYLGATGLREDHTIGNVSLLRRYRVPVFVFVAAARIMSMMMFAGMPVFVAMLVFVATTLAIMAVLMFVTPALTLLGMLVLRCLFFVLVL